MSIAHSSQIVLISAKSLRNCLCFVGAMTVVYDLPNCVVLNHLVFLKVIELGLLIGFAGFFSINMDKHSKIIFIKSN